jgi:hypothetical protein
MRKSAAASSAVALGLSATGTAAAQADDSELIEEQYKALIFEDEFRPNARFSFVSGVIEWVPNWADVRDSLWSDYNTFQIRWLDNGGMSTLFVTEDATQDLPQYDEDLGFIPDDEDPQQPAVYEMSREWAPFGDNEQLRVVNFSPISESEEDEVLDDDGWWVN